MTPDEMKRIAETAARVLAGKGGDRVQAVTLVGEPVLVGAGLWVIRVRLMMHDGTVRAFACDATDRDVFAVREVTAA